MLVDLLSGACLIGGAALGIVGGVGVLRLPDFYTRLHAVSVTDTLCAGLVLLGLGLQAGWSLVTVKLLIILAFFFLTSPTSAHALARAALHGGLHPAAERLEER